MLPYTFCFQRMKSRKNGFSAMPHVRERPGCNNEYDERKRIKTLVRQDPLPLLRQALQSSYNITHFDRNIYVVCALRRILSLPSSDQPSILIFPPKI